MEILERVLDEQAHELARTLTERADFTPAEADRLFEAARPVLVQSYEWQSRGRPHADFGNPQTARDVLAGMPGRWVAEAAGLSQAKAWAGLRTLVPAALEATSRADRRRGRGSGVPHPRLLRRRTDVGRFELGLG